MKQLLLLIGVICILSIEARNVQESETDATSDDSEENTLLKHIKDHANGQMRHKRRSRQSHYDYWNPYQFDIRRDYDRRQDDVLAQIFRQLEELSAYVKRPPPPPIYIPYPVIYSVPQYSPCNCKPSQPNITLPVRNGIPEMEDENQNWGPVLEETPEEGFDFDDDGTRPIVLKPIGSNRPSQSLPPLEHGSSQAGVETTTRASVKMPGMCQAAVLFCCKLEQQQKCFAKYGCQRTYRSGQACRPEVIKRVIAEFAEAYSPIN